MRRSIKLVSAAISAAMVCGAGAANADNVAFTAGGGPGPKSGGPGCKVMYEDGAATIPWSECEGRSIDGLRSAFWDDCAMISRFLGDAKIACRFDKPSFERHYTDVAKRKAAERSAAGDPDNTAGMAMKCFSEGGAAMGGVVQAYSQRPKVIADMRNRIGTVTVRYDQKVEPNAKLAGKDLVLTVRVATGRENGIGSGCAWIAAGALAAFPELKKEFDDHQ